MRRRNADAQRAGKDAQHEARRDDEDIEQDHMFQAHRVTDVEQGISQDDDEYRIRRSLRQHRRRNHADPGQQQGVRDAHGAGSKGPQALLGMLAITFAIGQIVDYIDCRRGQRKGGGGEQHAMHQQRILPGMAKQQADEDETALHPLMRAEQFEVGRDAAHGRGIFRREIKIRRRDFNTMAPQKAPSNAGHKLQVFLRDLCLSANAVSKAL